METLRERDARRPFTGAWIETVRMETLRERDARRPFTGAWIETLYRCLHHLFKVVAPSRGRGLKHGGRDAICRNRQVAPSRGRGLKRVIPIVVGQAHRRPFTGAWIETRKRCAVSRDQRVAPSRGRGLKREQPDLRDPRVPSPLHGGVD